MTRLTRDRAQISVSSENQGMAGNLSVTANNILLNNALLSAETVEGDDANINLFAQGTVQLLNGSRISTNAAGTATGGNLLIANPAVILLRDQSSLSAENSGGTGDGGNINLRSDFLIAAPEGQNQIIANAFEGNGGNINIAVTSLIGEDFLDISASSEFGLDGEIEIDSPDLDPARGITELPTGLVDTSNQIANACAVDRQGQSQFVATGRGGLPTLPSSRPTGKTLLSDLGPLVSRAAALQEAQTWTTAANGDIVLTANAANPQSPTLQPLNTLLQQAAQAYYQADYAQAATLWEQTVTGLAQGYDPQTYASTLSNLALAYHHLGNWDQAQQALVMSRQVLAPEMTPPQLLAQILNTEASLQLASGHTNAAINTWQQAAVAYRQANNEWGQLQARLNQLQALQSMGFYHQAQAQLETIVTALAEQPPSPVKAMALLHFGNGLRTRGEGGRAQQTLEAALSVAQSIDRPVLTSLILLNLGHTERTLASPDQALAYYQEAITAAPTPLIQFQAQISQLEMMMATDSTAAQTLWSNLASDLQQQMTTLPISRETIYAQLYLVQMLLRFGEEGGSSKTVLEVLSSAAQQAQTLKDPVAQAYTLGYQAQVYGQQQQWSEAQALTETALNQAQTLQTQGQPVPEMVYQWAWQLGRYRKAQGNRTGAIAAYTEAIDALRTLRGNLAVTSDEVQFDFRDEVEPVYRELVKLLLQGEAKQPANQADLKQARALIEDLQLAELNDYFQDACVQANPIAADQIDPAAAVIYPILLNDRLDVLVSMAGQPIRHYSTSVSSAQVEQTANQVLRLITTPLGSSQTNTTEHLQQLYDWMIGPAATDLAQQEINTLVFVADGILRTLPLNALHDGKQYLIEQYNVTLSPGLELLAPRPSEPEALRILAGGLSESHSGFPPLPFVANELERVTAQIPNHQVLFNQDLTKEKLANSLTTAPAEVVHLATHGEFGTSAEETFILTWEGKLTLKELSAMLQTRNRSNATPVELIVFSACKTATGDSRAVLGIAGMAIRSGVHSALAGLWPLNDQATATFMPYFYQALAEPGTTKAEAFRQAQLALMKDSQLSAPYYWSPFVLVGSWL